MQAKLPLTLPNPRPPPFVAPVLSTPPPLPPASVASAASALTDTVSLRCLITAVAAPADAPGTAAALSLLLADPPADVDADTASAAPVIALDSTVPASAVVALGRYADPRSRRPGPPLPLTPQFAAPDDPAHASALGFQPLLTAPRSRLSLLPLPPLAPLSCALPTSLRPPAPEDAPCTPTRTFSCAAPALAATPANAVTCAVAPVRAVIATPPLLPRKPPPAHPKFRPQVATVAPPPARFRWATVTTVN